MKLQCAQEALAEALAAVGRVVPGKTTLPVLTNVLLEADPGDGLRLVATNLDLAAPRDREHREAHDSARSPTTWHCWTAASRFR